MTQATRQQMLTRREAAEIIGVKPQTLRHWATLRRGPEFVKDGRKVMYPAEALQRWIDERAADDSDDPVYLTTITRLVRESLRYATPGRRRSVCEHLLKLGRAVATEEM